MLLAQLLHFSPSRAQLAVELAAIAVAAALLTLALAAVALFLFRRRAREWTLLFFAVFCFLYTVRLLSERDLVRALFSEPINFWSYLNWTITCTILLPFSFFFRLVMPENLKKHITWMLVAQSAFAVFGIVGAAAGMRLSTLGLANNLVVLSTILLGILLFFFGTKGSSAWVNRDVRIFVVGFLIWVAFAVHANLRGMGIVRGQNVEFLGFFVFVACLAYISLNRIFANEQRLLAIDKELEIARTIQSSILPKSVPAHTGLEIAARYVPMSAVAGDFYDFLPVDGHCLGVLVADVTGHGVPAALIASMLKVAFVGQTPHAHDPARVLTGLNQALCGKFEEHFVTAVYVFIDLEKEILRYGAAGHPPQLLASKNSAEITELAEGGLMLGLFPEAEYSYAEMPIASGSRCLLFTDGLIESANPSQEEFGKERCKQFLQSNTNLSAANFVGRLLDAVAGFSGHASGHSQSDDITILALDFQ